MWTLKEANSTVGSNSKQILPKTTKQAAEWNGLTLKKHSEFMRNGVTKKYAAQRTINLPA